MVELDEAKLRRVMELSGAKTQAEAVEFALGEAERNCLLNRLLSESFFTDTTEPVIRSDFDLQTSRLNRKL